MAFEGLEGLEAYMAQIDDTVIIDWGRFEQARASLGVNFFRVLGYFREDGGKAVRAIEEAMRSLNAGAMIVPADMIKVEGIQLGALAVAELAEDIEFQARDCVEWHQSPAMLLEDVVQLRALFDQAIAAFDQETNPLQIRRPGERRGAALEVRS